TTALWIWFLLNLVGGMASGLRWVLSEAVVAEFAPPGKRGLAIGIFETMVGTTFVIGPALLAWVGTQNDTALWIALGLLGVGLVWSLAIPRLPPADDAHSAHVGLTGVWRAFAAHPLTMAIGFVGGFFESGITSILPLYGLALGLGAAAAALLVSASGLGSALMMLPAGMLADRLAIHPSRRFGDAFAARRLIMRGCATITLLATLVIPFVMGSPWLAAPVAFLWGGAGGCLYTMVMIDIGSRESGITLVNSTAVLVLSYTLGGVLAPALGAAALQWSPAAGFPALLLLVASGGCWLLWRRQRQGLDAQGAVDEAPATGEVGASCAVLPGRSSKRSAMPPPTHMPPSVTHAVTAKIAPPVIPAPTAQPPASMEPKPINTAPIM